jgi:phospholipid/cholesterol/gamma-HCH transport system substrate-binding protein
MDINKEIKVGLLATTALLIIYLGFNFLKGKEIFAKTNTYYAIYSNAQGISTSSKVMINGCPVGMVHSVDIIPDQAYNILVGISISRDIKLTDKSIAKLATNNILGNKIIELLIKEGNTLHQGDTIQSQVDQDFQAVFLESTLPTLQDAKAISELTNRFMHNLVDNTDRINSIFTNLETAARQMREAISINQKDVGTISKNITEITEAISDQTVGIRPLLSKMNQLSDDVGSMKLNDLATRVDHILARFEEGTLHNNLNLALVSLDDLLIDLRQQPNRYVHFSVFGRRPSLAPKKNKIIPITKNASGK